jgi:hypothetical protein
VVHVGDKKFINVEGLRAWTVWPPPLDKAFDADLPQGTPVSIRVVMPADSDGSTWFAVETELHGQELFSMVREDQLGDVS